MSQTSYSLNPAVGRVGMLADSRTIKNVRSRLADGDLAAGLALGLGEAPTAGGADPGSVKTLVASPAIGVDVDHIVTTHATAASDQTLTGTSLNGTVGGGVMTPSRNVTVTLNSHANWDATTGYIRGYDAQGNFRSESLTIPDGGNVTLTTVIGFSQVVEVFIPTQSGTAGSYTVGIAAGGVALGKHNVAGVALYDASREPNTSTAEYDDNVAVPLLTKGAVYVSTEEACTPSSPVFVRITAAGAEEAGGFRTSSDSGDAFPMMGCRYLLSSGIAGLNVLELDF